MRGNKTHQQQRNVIEKRENTANAPKDFDPGPDLRRSEAAKDAFRRGDNLDMRAAEVSLHDDPSIIRGRNQESEHHKGKGS
ncbi:MULTISPECIES: hypothetical protein [unclassified Neorhizobium]|uniref:hypothetical protein n=1 Tax=unclassified Neorhizobium TaxID=2629175 RepID=UPI001FF23D0A|nr:MULTISPECIES: hypothetical protein [unclassified Neorhizobium]MCJ9673507.1 hypothetical protein [Neorhizobium sp. SHOUNA12B]MCJ9742956.1 hypothetical protein [Neorhizobium sp. SHOUNA12A]